MTSLTRAKTMTRYASIGLVIALISYTIIRVALNILFGVIEANKQAKQIAIKSAPNVAFGKIPEPQLQPITANTATATISLDLVNSDLPQASSSAKVFKVASPELTLSAQDRARARAKSLGFISTPEQPTPTSFLWTNGYKQLSLSLIDQTFNLTSNFGLIDLAQRQTFTRFSQLATPITNFARNLFTQTDIQFSSPQLRYVSPVESTFLPQDPTATAPTNYFQATFFRQNLDDLPIYDATGKSGPISMVIVPAQKTVTSTTITADQVIQIANHYFSIDTTSSAVYPIQTAQKAYAKLQANPSQFLVSVEPTGLTKAHSFLSGRVLFVTLVYLEPNVNNNQYVQPAWMFEGTATTDVGDADWVAYVPAIDQDATTTLLAK